MLTKDEDKITARLAAAGWLPPELSSPAAEHLLAGGSGDGDGAAGTPCRLGGGPGIKGNKGKPIDV